MTSEYKITVCYAIKQMQISPEQKLVLNKEMAHLFRMQAMVKTEIRLKKTWFYQLLADDNQDFVQLPLPV